MRSHVLFSAFAAGLAVSAAPGRREATCVKDMYLTHLEDTWAYADPFCSKYAAVPLPTPLPSWLAEIRPAATQVESACCCYLSIKAHSSTRTISKTVHTSTTFRTSSNLGHTSSTTVTWASSTSAESATRVHTSGLPSSTSCVNDMYLKHLKDTWAYAKPFCSRYADTPLPTPLPSWLAEISPAAAQVESACSCYLSTAAATATAANSSTIKSNTSTPTAQSSLTPSHTAQPHAAARTAAPAGAVIVDQSGKNSQYTTVQEGVDALSTTETGLQYLFIYPGVYKEQVYIAPRNANLTVQGYTPDSSSYHSNAVNVTYNLALINTTTDDLTATVRAWAENLKMYNINILNTFGHTNSQGQNLALSAYATNQGYYGVGLYGYQDTLLAEAGLQIYARSLILGAVDFIFGQTAQAWLDQIDIVTIGAGCITASGRDSDNPSWYVINNSTVRGGEGTAEADEGKNYLGRPWRDYARVTFQSTYLAAVVNPAGWSVWGPTDPQTDNVTFEEYGNFGPGSFPTEGPRANFSTQLTAPISIDEVLGQGFAEDWFVDLAYLS